MAAARDVRTLDDLERTVRALATEFKADKVFIIGSQAILIGWPDAPVGMRNSPEVDAYPENAKFWELEESKVHPGAEASEHINGLFGYGSLFHRTQGFYIDGVDENTARLPPDWQRRALVLPVQVSGRTVLAVAPCPEDLIVSKLARLDPKDREFVATYHAARPLDLPLIERRLREGGLEPEVVARAVAYLRTLTQRDI